MRRLMVGIVLVAAVFYACEGDGASDNDLPTRRAMMREIKISTDRTMAVLKNQLARWCRSRCSEDSANFAEVIDLYPPDHKAKYIKLQQRSPTGRASVGAVRGRRQRQAGEQGRSGSSCPTATAVTRIVPTCSPPRFRIRLLIRHSSKRLRGILRDPFCHVRLARWRDSNTASGAKRVGSGTTRPSYRSVKATACPDTVPSRDPECRQDGGASGVVPDTSLIHGSHSRSPCYVAQVGGGRTQAQHLSGVIDRSGLIRPLADKKTAFLSTGGFGGRRGTSLRKAVVPSVW